ncbi:unnamed protein product [Durusdinium trenchii]|uniref:Uncharacterized protein n=1 Tax=Durusdinium trenchii TaxID=1381693 RepID=A0ABP0LEN0_9DINO
MPWRALAIGTFILVHQTLAWSGEGHLQVALVAQHFLREKLRHKVKDLLKGDLVDFAHYEERLTVANSTMCHFHHQSPEWQCGQGIGRQGKVHCDGSEAGYFSLLCAVGLTFQKFAHDALMQEYPKSDYFKMPKPSDYWSNFKRLPEAAQYTEMLKTPEDELRWLAIFIGDMHQPLHWLRGDFDYGKNLTVVIRGQDHSLFDFWETELPMEFQLHDFAIFDRKGRMMKKLQHFSKHPGEVFATWGSDQSKVVCQQIYDKLNVTQGQTQPLAECGAGHRDGPSVAHPLRDASLGSGRAPGTSHGRAAHAQEARSRPQARKRFTPSKAVHDASLGDQRRDCHTYSAAVASGSPLAFGGETPQITSKD